MFLDNYERIRIVDKIKANYNGPHKVVEYPQNPEGNPHKRRKPNEKLIVVSFLPWVILTNWDIFNNQGETINKDKKEGIAHRTKNWKFVIKFLLSKKILVLNGVIDKKIK